MTDSQKAAMYDAMIKALNGLAQAHAMRSTVPLSENRLFRDQVYSFIEDWRNRQPMGQCHFGEGIARFLGPEP